MYIEKGEEKICQFRFDREKGTHPWTFKTGVAWTRAWFKTHLLLLDIYIYIYY
jgi:hypothetical protein